MLYEVITRHAVDRQRITPRRQTMYFERLPAQSMPQPGQLRPELRVFGDDPGQALRLPLKFDAILTPLLV